MVVSRRPRRRQSGHTLIVALVVLVLVGATAGVLAVTLQMRSRLSLQETRRVNLVALADAALAEALAGLAASSGYQGTLEHRFGAGIIGSTVSRAGTARFEIIATARISGWERQVRAEVDRTGAGLIVRTWQVLPRDGP